MAFDRFLIGFTDGNASLQTNLRPWLIADNAFQALNNAYVFRGRVRKRFGSNWMGVTQFQSRFRVSVGTTDAGTGNLSGTVPGTIFEPGQAFSIGNSMYTVYNAAAGAQPMYDNGTPVTTTKTFDVSTGDFVFVGAPKNKTAYWYPALPVMGLTLYEVGPINNQPSYGFDTEFAYVFTAGIGWDRSVDTGNPVFNAANRADAGTLNFFWTCNWQDILNNRTLLFITNFNATVPTPNATDDPLWYLYVTSGTPTWTIFIPYFAPAGGAAMTGPFVTSCRIIVAFKDRLLLLNTVENDGSGGGGVNSSHTNRCRYSFNGSPLATNAWYEPNQKDSGGKNAAGAGFIDATTKEAIISAEFIKDRLIVFFERSTWELAYTGNQILPFVWQKINTELGSESQQSSVPFDKQILTIGNTGVHACSGANVERIDDKIPDQVFDIITTGLNVQRVAGIRDYFVEMVYWAMPLLGKSPQNTEIFPNKVLVYNYKTGGWALNDDCITAFGYFEQQNDITWEDTAPVIWQEADFTWISGVEQAESRQVIAGNQEGYTFLIEADTTSNASVLQITNITTSAGNTRLTIYDHNLSTNVSIAPEVSGVTPDFVYISNSGTALDGKIFPIVTVVDINTVNIGLTSFGGTYTGGGVAARVSNINIVSKQWNPYVNKDRNVYLEKIDFGVFKTSAGQITVDYSPSATTLSMINAGIDTGTIMGTNILETSAYNPIYYPLEQEQQRVWHPIYFQSSGTCIQIYISFSTTQITTPAIAFSDFVIEAMILYTQATDSRLQ